MCLAPLPVAPWSIGQGFQRYEHQSPERNPRPLSWETGKYQLLPGIDTDWHTPAIWWVEPQLWPWLVGQAPVVTETNIWESKLCGWNMANWLVDLYIHSQRPWCWKRLRAGGEGGNRQWDGWMASPTQWTWVWVNSGSWWWTGRPGVLQFMGSQRVRHDWVTELNWTEWLNNNKSWLG